MKNETHNWIVVPFVSGVRKLIGKYDIISQIQQLTYFDLQFQYGSCVKNRI